VIDIPSTSRARELSIVILVRLGGSGLLARLDSWKKADIKMSGVVCPKINLDEAFVG
jgi:hypothetical protein